MNSYSFTVDKEMKVLSWDKNLERMQRKTAEEVAGTFYFDLLPRIWYGKNDAILQVLQGCKPLNLEKHRIYCFSAFSEVDITIVPLTDSNRQTIGAEVKVEMHYNCSLSQELHHSQTLMDIGKESITLAHGIRNPLNAIKGAVVYLKDRYESDATFTEFSTIIEEEIVKLENFITAFLSTSSVDNNIAKTSINILLDRIVQLTCLQAKAQNVQFVCDYHEVPFISVDVFQLEHAILNIINNSMEAMHQGGIVTLRTATASRNGGECVVIDIVDTGPGMTDSKVCDMLSPLRLKAKGGGKGFGLFITREVIQHHGGHLEIKSEKDVGTTIRISLPVKQEAGYE